MKISLPDFFRYYKHGNPNQMEAVALLESMINTKLLQDDSAWVLKYREQDRADNVLSVPYQSQRDNFSGYGHRECFSSSCAMVAMFWGVVENDDEYNRIRDQFGDSTDAYAQVRALRSLGLQAEFRTDGNPETLKKLINESRPIPCGWLHKGALPGHGGGHYAVIIGYSDETSTWRVHDPFGDCNLMGGFYESKDGKSLNYSYRNWNPRWEVDGPSTGWYMDIGPGKPEGGGDAAPKKISTAGVALIKKFEGLRLIPYRCSSNVLSVGYGSTGSHVSTGMTITEEEAEALLVKDLARFERAVVDLIDVPLKQNEFDAIVSFAFNCGIGALKDSTFRKRMNGGENKPTVFRTEFPRWTNKGLAGLVRRRDAEVALAIS